MKNATNAEKFRNANLNPDLYDLKEIQQQTKLYQGVSNDFYRSKFMELAKKLAVANTGQILIVNDDQALWLEEYEERKEGENDEDFRPVYDPYNYTSEDYMACLTKVNVTITAHQADLLSQRLISERSQQSERAAAAEYPSDLAFPRRNSIPGASCQTWIVNAEGMSRRRDYHVGNALGDDLYEGWMQLLPHEVIASWEKDCVSAPHFFRLEIYVDRRSVPPELTELMGFESSSGKLISLVVHSRMTSLAERQKEVLRGFFTPAQLEFLGITQAEIDYSYSEVLDPVYGNPSPGIEGGWLGLLGIEQNYVFEPVEVESSYVSESDGTVISEDEPDETSKQRVEQLERN